MAMLQSLANLCRARCVVYCTGSGIIALALATHFLALDLAQLFSWLEMAFGPVYLSSYVLLLAVSMLAISRLADPIKGGFWYETGVQAAAGIATLALTFTLLGISLGIESLSKQDISPDNIQPIITELTRHFSTAFLTSIVGLPTANALRAAVSIRWAALAINSLDTSITAGATL